MKLQEKHLEAIVNNIPIEGSLYSDAEKAAEASAQITKDYMKRFAEWLVENYNPRFGTSFLTDKSIIEEVGSNKIKYNDWAHGTAIGHITFHSTDELIQIFLETEK